MGTGGGTRNPEKTQKKSNSQPSRITYRLTDTMKSVTGSSLALTFSPLFLMQIFFFFDFSVAILNGN